MLRKSLPLFVRYGFKNPIGRNLIRKGEGMKKLIVITLLLFSGSLLFIENIGASDKNLVVMTFNIRVGVGMIKPGTPPHNLKNSPKILDSIAQAIKSVDPDIVGLQEVQGENQAKILAETLSMNYSYSRHGNNKDASWWGVAILSKYEIINSKNYTVYSGGQKPWRARTIIECTIKVNDKNISFFNTHFQHQGDALKKEPKNAIEKISESKNPVILMGDLNMQPDDSNLKPIKDALKDSCEAISNENSNFAKTNGTFQSPNDPKYDHWRIDYIFYDPKTIRIIDVGLVDKKYWDTSDHIGYFATIELI